ncbi:TonB-dependent receptor [Prevotella sp. P5-92]|uniref:TonB-dependent receptor n=1 Tax=Prevotella sp. P5-92 TaxID=2024222 RepID=UPI000B96C729|nr:outer membrane beta-barrel protein [Prevotella sp. P5-92]OYP54940.1 TonB-dependent receptor [Prevotella sp. P5-92]
MNKKKRYAVMAAAICVFMYADANDTIRTGRIDEVVVTAERSRKTNIFETIPVQSLSGNDIRQLGLQNIADAVKRMAGTNVKDYGGIGGMKTVSVRNLGAQHTAVSYDGITVSNTQAGQIDIGRFSLDNVGMLSMAIGQGSDIMQTARHYASAALLAIETERPVLDKGDSRLRLALKGGSWGQLNPSVRWWCQAGENTMTTLDADYMRADGRYPFVLRNGKEKSNEKRNNSDIEQWHGEANVLHKFGDGGSLDTKAYFYHSQRGVPGSVVLYNDNSKERLWDENFFLQTAYKRHIARQWKLAIRAKYTHSWNKYEDTNAKYANGKKTEVNRQDEYYTSATLGWKPTSWLEMALAEDVAVNKLRTTVNGSPNPLRTTSLTALVSKAKYGRMTIEGNIVMTYATESLTESEKYAIKKPEDRKKLSPSLSFSYRLLPDEALYVRAMTKSTFRLPTFNDLYYLQIGNTSLRPENAHEYGAGMTWNSRPIGPLRYVALTIDAYYNDVTDKIVAFPSTYIWKMVNFGKAEIKGIDATMGTEVDIVKGYSIVANGSLTWQEAKDKTEGSATYGSQLPYTPKVSGGLSVMLLTPWVNVGYSATGQGKRYSMAQNTREYQLDGYMEHSLSLSRDFLLGDNMLRLQLTVNNITDKQYEIIKYYPMPGRSVTASATLDI